MFSFFNLLHYANDSFLNHQNIIRLIALIGLIILLFSVTLKLIQFLLKKNNNKNKSANWLFYVFILIDIITLFNIYNSFFSLHIVK